MFDQGRKTSPSSQSPFAGGGGLAVRYGWSKVLSVSTQGEKRGSPVDRRRASSTRTDTDTDRERHKQTRSRKGNQSKASRASQSDPPGQPSLFHDSRGGAGTPDLGVRGFHVCAGQLRSDRAIAARYCCIGQARMFQYRQREGGIGPHSINPQPNQTQIRDARKAPWESRRVCVCVGLVGMCMLRMR